jgi:prepilin-type N-terminal cleavage/methylation domain-containing protein
VHRRTNKTAFTLVELMVVVVVILLAVGIALPTIVQLVTSGAQEQAYNTLAAQLASARALAIREATYAGVHVQRAAEDRVDDGELPANTMYASVVRLGDNGLFDVPDGFDPAVLPGRTAVGEISDTFIDGSNYDAGALGNAAIDDFTTVTFVFAPDGSLVTTVRGQPVLFDDTEDGFFRGDERLWDAGLANDDEVGVLAVCLFDYTRFVTLPDAAARRDMLNEAGRFLPVNVNTGQLFPRQ